MIDLISNIRDLSLKKKFMAVFGLTFFLMGLVILVGIVNMARMKDSSVHIFEDEMAQTQYYLGLKADLEEERRILLLMMIGAGRNREGPDLNKLRESAGRVEKDIADMLVRLTDPGERSNIFRLRSIHDLFRGTREKEVLPAIAEGRLDDAFELVTGLQARRFGEIISIAGAMVEHDKIESAKAGEMVREVFRRTMIVYAFIAAIALLVVLSLVIVLSRYVSRRLNAMTEAIERFNKGELNLKISADGKDELGVLAISFNEMNRRIYEAGISQEQYVNILSWDAKEKERQSAALKAVNEDLLDAKSDLEIKNSMLEKSVKDMAEANRKLEETKAQMIQSEKMASIGQLVSGVAHEINNPVGFVNSNMNTLSGYMSGLSELLNMYNEMAGALEAGRDDEVIRFLKSIDKYRKDMDIDFTVDDTRHLIEESKDGLDRIKYIVNGLKDFAHPEESGMKEADINRCIENAVRICWHEIKYKADLRREFGALPLVLCEPQQLGQVFLNLIINALQAISEQGVIIIKTYANGDNVVIEIKDNGAGIPEENMKKIFDPFFTTKPVGQGTGLGLSVVYGIVKKHKGAIDVESKVGSGTVFRITLPVRNEGAQVLAAGAV